MVLSCDFFISHLFFASEIGHENVLVLSFSEWSPVLRYDIPRKILKTKSLCSGTLLRSE